MSVPTTRLGKTNLEITRLGLGAWAIGGGGWQGGWGSQEDAQSIATVHHAVELGINWVDTAPAYGFGKAEEVVGEAVRQLPEPDRPYVFTKCGLVWPPGEMALSNVLAPASIRRECDESLRRLGVERIDLYQIHWPTEDGTPLEDSWETMAGLVDAGKVRYIGVSNFDVALLEKCQAIRRVDTYQPELNLINRHAAEAAIPWCAEHGTGVIVYSPMRSGLLTGAFSPERARSLPADDWRATHDDFQEPGLTRNLELVARLRDIAGSLGCSLPELAVAWTMAWPGVDGAIVGARKPDQVDGWVDSASVELTPADMRSIADALAATGAGEGPVLAGMAASELD